ncbi:MAG: hypothetical protein JNL47_06030 [Bacteroidia bacterium]|nr:hypothetical protein [Bacteroidia bacterium]
MKKSLPLGLLMSVSVQLNAQNVGIGIATPQQKLHVAGAGQTIRVDGLSGAGTRNVYANAFGDLTTTPGTPSDVWMTSGNAGLNASVNFLGTTDAVDFVLRTNNLERMRALSTGNIGIGVTAPTARLHVEVPPATGSIAIRGTNTSFGSGYIGYQNTINLGAFGTTPGAVMFSEEGTATANPSFIAVTRTPASYAANIAYSDVWIAGYFGTDNASASFNPPAIYGQLNVTNQTLAGFQIASRGFMNRAATAGNPGYSVGVQGLANSQNQDAIGVMGLTFSNIVTNLNSGGYFESNNYAGSINNAFAYVANAGLNRKIAGSGSVSEIIPTPNHGRITLTCPESPEYWYQDYGSVKMVNGFAHVDLDPILADIIIVDNDHPIRVFSTPVDMPNFKGITVTNRTATGFDLVELNGGNSTGWIDYQIIVKPKTNFGEGRFPQAPGPVGLKQDPPAAKARNQPDPTKIFRWPSDNVVYGYDRPKQEMLPVNKPESSGK